MALDPFTRTANRLFTTSPRLLSKLASACPATRKCHRALTLFPTSFLHCTSLGGEAARCCLRTRMDATGQHCCLKQAATRLTRGLAPLLQGRDFARHGNINRLGKFPNTTPQACYRDATKTSPQLRRDCVALFCRSSSVFSAMNAPTHMSLTFLPSYHAHAPLVTLAQPAAMTASVSVAKQPHPPAVHKAQGSRHNKMTATS